MDPDYEFKPKYNTSKEKLLKQQKFNSTMVTKLLISEEMKKRPFKNKIEHLKNYYQSYK